MNACSLARYLACVKRGRGHVPLAAVRDFGCCAVGADANGRVRVPASFVEMSLCRRGDCLRDGATMPAQVHRVADGGTCRRREARGRRDAATKPGGRFWGGSICRTWTSSRLVAGRKANRRYTHAGRAGEVGTDSATRALTFATVPEAANALTPLPSRARRPQGSLPHGAGAHRVIVRER